MADDGIAVGRRRADFLIRNDAGERLPETRARRTLRPEDTEQWMLHVQQGRFQVCLLVNFGQKPPAVRRFVYTPPEDARGR